jgi:pilus assembly protein CpaB
MTYSVRNIAIALALAAIAAVAVVLYTSSYKDQVTRDQERVAVMVASQDIPAGTPGEQAAGMMGLQEVLRTDFTPGALTSSGGLEGKVTSQEVFAGQQVHSGVFQTPTTQAAALSLDKTERGVRVRVDFASGALGAIKAGDRVDYFMTMEVVPPGGDGGEGFLFSRRLMTDVRVLEAPEPAVEEGPGKLSEEEDKGDDLTLMLAVTQEDATKLAFTQAAKDADKTLITWVAVRPPDGQAEEVAVTIENAQTMLADGVPVAELKQNYGNYIDELETAKLEADARRADASNGPTVSEAQDNDVTATEGND